MLLHRTQTTRSYTDKSCASSLEDPVPTLVKPRKMPDSLLTVSRDAAPTVC